MVDADKKLVVFWSAIFVALCCALYLVQDILMPFILAFIIAYIFDPLVNKLQRFNLSRGLATFIILIVVVMILVVSLFFILPLLAKQLGDFITSLPALLKVAQDFLNAQYVKLEGSSLGPYLTDKVQNGQASLNPMISETVNIVVRFLASLWTGGQAIFSFISLLIVSPIIACYLIYDWDRIEKAIDDLLPRAYAKRIQTILAEINAALSAYLRGQASICLLLGVIYAVGLTVLGLKFSLLIGITSGLLAFVPYVGNIIGLGAALLVALSQFGADLTMITAVIGVFVTGQVLDGYVLQPKLIGKAVGLHPVWLFFALFACGALFGFWGVLLAVPIGATVAILLRHGLGAYRASRFYQGAAVKGH